MNKTVGSAIREARKSRRMSAEKLGGLLDPPVSHVAVCAWETGKNNPNAKTIMQIGEILDVDVRCFFTNATFEDDTDIESTTGMGEISRCYSKMNDAQRAAILTVVKSMVD